MQTASAEYKQSMKSPLRGRGYIKVSLGVINQLAQQSAALDTAYLFRLSSTDGGIFSGVPVTKPYATAEHDWSRIDGSMYFAPASGQMYVQGAISNGLSGAIRITFGGVTDLDIKGFTIDFGNNYPTRFTITTNNTTETYDNGSRYFSTEDTFDGTNYIDVIPVTMLYGENRLRIYSFTCGIANTFTNDEIISFSSKEYVSPISDSLPSMDMSITIDNQDQYYNPDNPSSALSYMEVGQEMTVQFGYDVDGTGENIEWIEAQKSHLKSWSASDVDAKFTAVDKFDYLLNGKYTKGQYAGTTLYNLAVAVLTDAGITDTDDYFIDSYLRNITVTNPLPPVRHSEALQIIANAARCCLYIDRQDRIHITGNFMPGATVTAPHGQAAFSRVTYLLESGAKEDFANASKDFSVVDGSLYFYQSGYGRWSGFASSVVANAGGGLGGSSNRPQICIVLDYAFTFYGMKIVFRNTCPEEFLISFYVDTESVGQISVTGNTDMIWSTTDPLPMFNRMYIDFIKGYPNSRVFVDEISFGATTDYTLTRDNDITGSPVATRENRIQSISVLQHNYSNSTEDIKSLKSETVNKTSGATYTSTIDFSKPCYGYTIVVKSSSGGGYGIAIAESGPYYAVITINGAATMVQYEIRGYEYVVTDTAVTNTYHASGDIITWDNPLISQAADAQNLADWLADYYLGDVTYQIPWRGDPRVDANDLFNLELKTGEETMIRAHQNELSFNGGWSGSLTARKYNAEG